MRLLNTTSGSDGSLIAEFEARMGEAVARQRADIEVRAARMEAELAIRARSEFLANMNHELRTPLNAIIGFSTMLRDIDEYSLGEEQKRSYAEYILQSADLLLGHINTLLEVAALESGKIELSDDNFDLNDVVTDSLKRSQIRCEAAGVSITRHGGDEAAPAWGDAEKTGQALDHIIQIAVKSSEEGGRILVRAQLDGHGNGEIAVRDTGDGFDAEEIFAALEAFKQPQRGLERSFSGPGVGYAVAKTFIEMQGGRFAIKSRKGQGTLVLISLPHASSAEGETTEEETEAPQEALEQEHDAA